MAGPLMAAVEPGFHLPWQERRDRLRERIEQRPLSGVSPEEIAAHFGGMPAHYWEVVDYEDLVWGLETIHGFLQLVAAPSVPATTPFMD